ncbi:DNA repair protein RecN [Saccharophagus sp. K07]|uniref:DNA repair protein RecN n=1 Tax=Saccharophagus sp. K07 TaxID=2283636 RepID=UPI001652A101|nr:DNA repair protein RecN [Saccharophagus sp. K07]
MLTHLQVSDFTLVSQLSLDFGAGLTVLTGETGAGKSILLDALGLALGDRAEADKVRAGAERAEVTACFDISRLTQVQQWLRDADLDADDCIVRRVVTGEGRSRAYINGQLVTLTQLRELGDQLLDIHSQHEHQSLLQTATHRRLLDDYGRHQDLVEQVKAAFVRWQELETAAERVRTNSSELNARHQLLSYQVEELDQLGLAPGEVENLEGRQRQLAHAAQIQQSCQAVADMCNESDDSMADRLHRALHLLNNLPFKSPRLAEVESMLQGALIQVQEAHSELHRELAGFEEQEDNLFEIEQRLSTVYEIARKHRVAPEALAELHEQLALELKGLQSGDEQLAQLEEASAKALADYRELAQRLSGARTKAAKALSKAVGQQLAALAMGHAVFEIALREQKEPGRWGAETVEFLISTIPGQPAKPLAKIASGGELSRISLAIQVVVAKTSIIPTLVFDEVDAGIGGTTGDVVGQMLRQLGESAQILCVTHLAQVASKAHQHLKVEKTVSKKGASTAISRLEGEAKVVEIARMMGGGVESPQSLAHAREMLGV